MVKEAVLLSLLYKNGTWAGTPLHYGKLLVTIAP